MPPLEMDTQRDTSPNEPNRTKATGDAPVDDRLRALVSPVRRRAVRHLGVADGSCTVDELVRACADHPTDEGILRGDLVHNHLPLLASAHVIEWSDDRNVVARGVELDATMALLRAVDAHRSEFDGGDEQ